MKPPDNTPPRAARQKKPYSKPALRIYGTVRAITRNTGTMSAQADGPGPMSKTA